MGIRTEDLNKIPDVNLPDFAEAFLYKAEMEIEENGAAGVYTASVTLPAGATIYDIVVHGTALWGAGTSATLKVGDVADDDGFYTAVNLKATDLLAGESLSINGMVGGKQGADVVPGTYPAGQVSRRYLATQRVVSAIVTTVGTAASTGRTRVTVLFWTAQNARKILATKV
jgi:hypothetical protein